MSIFEELKHEEVPVADVAKLFGTSPGKIREAIMNGTLPIGFATKADAIEGGRNRTVIIKSRLAAWVKARDLGGEVNEIQTGSEKV